jgi:hypothetical protein
VATGPVVPPVDLSPAPEPEGLVVIGRVAKPEAILRTASGWARLPLPGADDLVRSLADDAVASSLDLTQPVDGAVVVVSGHGAPKPLYAFAAAVRSFEEAKSRLGARHRLTPAGNGGFDVHGIGRAEIEPGGTDDEEDDELTCVLAHAASMSPAAGARLVCGEPAALEALTPYLTRSLPRQSFPADVHAELRFAPIRKPVADLRMQLPILARGLLNTQSSAVRDFVEAAVGELADIVSDTNKISIDATVADAGFETTMRAEYGSANSIVAQLATTGVDRAGPAPASFFHVPQESDLAFFGHGSDPKLWERPRTLLGNLLVETFTEGGMPEAERTKIEELVTRRMLPLFTGPAVYASGHDAQALERAFAARKAVRAGDAAAAAEADRLLGEQVVGFHLFQVKEPIANVGPILKDWSALFARPGFVAWTKKQKMQKSAARLRVAPLPSAVVLPKETVHLEITIPREEDGAAAKPSGSGRPGGADATKKITKKPLVAHVFAVPDAGTTWLAFGLDGVLVAKKAAVALSSGPQTGTLGSAAADLGVIRDATKINGAATLSLRGLLALTAFERAHSPYEKMSALPNQGASPIVLTFAAEPPASGGPGALARGTLRIPRGTIEDVIRIAMTPR